MNSFTKLAYSRHLLTSFLTTFSSIYFCFTASEIPSHTSETIAVDTVFASQHTVYGQYEPAYLQTNMIGSNTNTNTFRVIQEQTTAMAFEWKPMTHENFDYVLLVQVLDDWCDVAVRFYEGDIGLLESLGLPCEDTSHTAEGYTTNAISSNFQTYHLTHKRIPRIQKVRIQYMQDMYPVLKWEKEQSVCETTDVTIIFRGYSTQQLQMYVISGDQVEHYMNDFQTEEGMEEVFILFNRHGNRFSLPTMGNIFLCFSCIARFF
ncbi:unnamed protein product [Schistosoma margrebowiei]|uniref:Uncharacterized protein n=1 Tax=Schistosoma margrebowiei TaxID=48269 RepID=A0AA85APK4_9TREM|nr:unnamed protein product [Schistosoma margrebowiei]